MSGEASSTPAPNDVSEDFSGGGDGVAGGAPGNELEGGPEGDANDGAEAIVAAAFGEGNRKRLIEHYFSQSGVELTRDRAWEHVYRLLLWTDRTTGLAHCYESDKSQPGKPWYARSLAFHDWLAAQLGAAPGALAEEIDWLFRRASAELETAVARRAADLAYAAELQRRPFAARGFPQPGQDPELERLVRAVLGPHLAQDPPPEKWLQLGQRIRGHIAGENKRRNLLGEGFEDTLAAILRRLPETQGLEIFTRRLLHDIRGFTRQRAGDKPNKVDLAIVRPNGGLRTIVTAKWSVRADREKQFVQEYAEYLVAEGERRLFEYVFVTSEFDPARLMRACEQLHGNAPMFTHVVHISTDALAATYRAGGRRLTRTMATVLDYIESGRLIDLRRWISLAAAA